MARDGTFCAVDSDACHQRFSMRYAFIQRVKDAVNMADEAVHVPAALIPPVPLFCHMPPAPNPPSPVSIHSNQTWRSHPRLIQLRSAD